MSVTKGYALIHAIADQNGCKAIWADEVEDENSQSAMMEKARQIIKDNLLNG